MNSSAYRLQKLVGDKELSNRRAFATGDYEAIDLFEIGRQSHGNGSDLAAALKRGDRPEIDARLRDLLGTCVACHAAYRIY